jgi:hypothetical protein
MVLEVNVIIIRAFPSLYRFHLVTAAARRWVKQNVEGQRDKTVRILEVERKFARDVAFGMDIDELRIASDTKGVLS